MSWNPIRGFSLVYVLRYGRMECGEWRECWEWDRVLGMGWSVGDRSDCGRWEWEDEGRKNLLYKILLNIAWLRQGKYTLGSDMN